MISKKILASVLLSAAATVGAAGTASAAPLAVTPAAPEPILEGGAGAATGSSALLPVLLPLLASGSAHESAALNSAEAVQFPGADAGTGSSATLLPLLALLSSGSAHAPAPTAGTATPIDGAATGSSALLPALLPLLMSGSGGTSNLNLLQIPVR